MLKTATLALPNGLNQTIFVYLVSDLVHYLKPHTPKEAHTHLMAHIFEHSS